MKKIIFILLFTPLIFNCTSDSSDENTNSVDDTNPVYLDTNGVTIIARDWAVIGDEGIINGVNYTIVDKDILLDMIINRDDVSRVCTSKINDMSHLFSDAYNFNPDISSWDVSNVTNMRRMFRLSGPFNQNLGSWNVNNVTDCNGFCYSTPNWTLTKPSFSNCGDTECE